ncbi:MAG: hypothetical protein WC969_12030 [Elusimicrobiota bacterium]
MNTIVNFRKSAAAVLCAALILTSPGLPVCEALAQQNAASAVNAGGGNSVPVVPIGLRTVPISMPGSFQPQTLILPTLPARTETGVVVKQAPLAAQRRGAEDDAAQSAAENTIIGAPAPVMVQAPAPDVKFVAQRAPVRSEPTPAAPGFMANWRAKISNAVGSVLHRKAAPATGAVIDAAQAALDDGDKAFDNSLSRAEGVEPVPAAESSTLQPSLLQSARPSAGVVATEVPSVPAVSAAQDAPVGFWRNLRDGLSSGRKSFAIASFGASGWLAAATALAGYLLPSYNLVPGMMLASALPAGLFLAAWGLFAAARYAAGVLPSLKGSLPGVTPLAARPLPVRIAAGFLTVPAAVLKAWLARSFPAGTLKRALLVLALSLPMAAAFFLAPALGLGASVATGIALAAALPAAGFIAAGLVLGVLRGIIDLVPGFLKLPFVWAARLVAGVFRLLGGWLSRSFPTASPPRGLATLLVSAPAAAAYLALSSPAVAAYLALHSFASAAVFLPGLLAVAAVPGLVFLSLSLVRGFLRLVADLLPGAVGRLARRNVGPSAVKPATVQGFALAAGSAGFAVSLALVLKDLPALAPYVALLVSASPLPLVALIAGVLPAAVLLAYGLAAGVRALLRARKGPDLEEATPAASSRVGAALFASSLPLSVLAALSLVVPALLPLQAGLRAAAVLPTAVFLVGALVGALLRGAARLTAKGYGALPAPVRFVTSAPFKLIATAYRGASLIMREAARGGLAPFLWALSASALVAGTSFALPALAGFGLPLAALGAPTASLAMGMRIAAGLPLAGFLLWRLGGAFLRPALGALKRMAPSSFSDALPEELRVEFRQTADMVERYLPAKGVLGFPGVLGAAVLAAPAGVLVALLSLLAPSSLLVPGLWAGALLPFAHFALGTALSTGGAMLAGALGLDGASLRGERGFLKRLRAWATAAGLLLAPVAGIAALFFAGEVAAAAALGGAIVMGTLFAVALRAVVGAFQLDR